MTARLIRSLTASVLFALLAAGPIVSRGADAPATDADKSKVLAQDAIRKGLDFLKANQKKNGAWSDENYPALTAFGLWVFAQSDHPDRAAVCSNAARFVASCVRPDGGIYEVPGKILFWKGGLATYNTAVCMTALHAYDARTYAAAILAARKFIAGNQLLGDPADNGGVGGFSYDRPGKGYVGRPDLSNTAWALNSMRSTQDLEDQRTDGKRVDVDWAASLKYIEKLQNNDPNDADNQGGFGYEKGGSRGGTTTNREGVVTLKGYGSMTYAGLLSLIYAEVDRKDPRVASAVQWASRHWSVDENPGMGSKGLFYYYTIMAKALNVVGGDSIPREKGDPIPWKQELIQKLVGLQKADGSWANKDNQYWEGNPVLATTDALLALQYAVSH